MERRPYREEEDAYYPPAPPPYSETDSQASRERRLKKVSEQPALACRPSRTLSSHMLTPFSFSPLQNLALSRESLVV